MLRVYPLAFPCVVERYRMPNNRGRGRDNQVERVQFAKNNDTAAFIIIFPEIGQRFEKSYWDAGLLSLATPPMNKIRSWIALAFYIRIQMPSCAKHAFVSKLFNTRRITTYNKHGEPANPVQ